MYRFYPIQRTVSLKGFYTAFERTFTPDYVFRGETHDFYELVLITQGSVGITAGPNSFVLDAPAAILHPPMEFHAIRYANGDAPKILVFSFSADILPRFDNHIFPLNTSQIEKAKEILSLLEESGVMKEDAEISEEKAKLSQMALINLEQLFLTLTRREDLPIKKENSASSKNYRHALRAVEENLTLPLDTQELAKLTHMSRSLLKKVFAQHAGIGVMEYVRTRKINAAIPFLREGMSVQEISTRLGFSNAGYFSTVFRRITGHTPSYYRNH